MKVSLKQKKITVYFEFLLKRYTKHKIDIKGSFLFQP